MTFREERITKIEKKIAKLNAKLLKQYIKLHSLKESV
jgi:hypothetical protein